MYIPLRGATFSLCISASFGPCSEEIRKKNCYFTSRDPVAKEYQRCWEQWTEFEMGPAQCVDKRRTEYTLRQFRVRIFLTNIPIVLPYKFWECPFVGRQRTSIERTNGLLSEMGDLCINNTYLTHTNLQISCSFNFARYSLVFWPLEESDFWSCF